MKRLLRRCCCCCCCCCNKGYESYQGEEQWSLSALPGKGEQASVDDLATKSEQARRKAWEALGSLEPAPTTQNLTPALTGPKWPASRTAFRLIRRPNGNVVLASDGLSDPFDDITLGEPNMNGFGLEFFIETPQEELAADLKKSWQFQLLFTVSQLAAGHGGIRAILDDMQLLSTEAEGVSEAVPEEARAGLVNSAGRVGALLGLQSLPEGAAGTATGGGPAEDGSGASHAEGSGVPDRIPGMPLSEVKLVCIKLLTLAELRLITDKGGEGRRQLSDLFTGPGRLVSSLRRPSAVGEEEPLA